MKFLTDFTYRNLHGFARFPGDSTAPVLNDNAQHYTHPRFTLFYLLTYLLMSNVEERHACTLK